MLLSFMMITAICSMVNGTAISKINSIAIMVNSTPIYIGFTATSIHNMVNSIANCNEITRTAIYKFG